MSPPRAAALMHFDAGELEVESSGAALRLQLRVVVGDAHPYLRAHFPDERIFPGVFVLELLGQIVERALGARDAKRLRCVAVSSAHFSSPFVPGDALRLSAEVGPDL